MFSDGGSEFVPPRFLAQGKLQMIGILIENRVNGTYSIGYASGNASVRHSTVETVAMP